ncbi:MCM6 factor, partial [Galbula dea]|nr:MCM6 factor [Galbula dea]
PKHVKEAFRLLNKSIIRVETPDINLDQDDEQQMEDQEDQDGVNGETEAPAGVNGLVNGINGHSEDTNKDAAPKASLRLGFSEYRRISNLLVLHLRKAEEEEDDSSLKKSELINWYLKEIESEIESEEELINKKKIIERVIHRLTHYDHILIELSQSGLRGSREKETFDEDPYLVVNPNYLLED